MQTEHRMQLICDGIQPKREVLDYTIEQFKEVYIKARREFEVVVNVCQLVISLWLPRHPAMQDKLID